MRLAIIFLAACLILSMQVVSAEFALEVKKIDKGSIVISELGHPAVFELDINNPKEEDSIEIYSLAGISIAP